MRKNTKDILLLFALCVPLAYMSGLSDLIGYPLTITLAFIGAVKVVIKEKTGKTYFEKHMEKAFGGRK
jgi:hypothetical protein